MSAALARGGRVARLDFRHYLGRPLLVILVLIVVLSSWGLTTGNLRISSGDATVGGKKAWITSEHSNAFSFCFMTLLFYAFFISVAAGTCITRDEELGVGEILHTTGLRPREYVWGKFAGVTAPFLVVLGIHLGATMFCHYVLPVEDRERIIGPFSLRNYLLPAAILALPTMVFLSGITFWLGERTRRPVLAFLFPVALVMGCGFFFWEWDPAWLDPRIARVLALLDLSGYRWLNDTLLKVDRGVDYYNTQPVRWRGDFLASRVLFVALGLAAVAWSERHFARTLRVAQRVRGRGTTTSRAPSEAAEVAPDGGETRSAGLAAAAPVGGGPGAVPLAALAMRGGAPGLLRQVASIARFEGRGLAASAGLYLFVPLILMQTIVNAYFSEGVWGTRLIVTSGSFAIGTLDTVTFCTVALLLFYTVESLDRENATRLAPIYASTRVRTAAILIGKAVANGFVGLVIVFGAWIGAVVIMLVQHRVSPTPVPFLIVWGLLLAPTILVWSAFVMAVHSVVRNKYTTYGVCIGVLVLTGVMRYRGKMNWVWDWDVWKVTRWSDMGLLEPNGLPLLLNRVLYLAVFVLCIAFAVRLLPRREPDATRIVHRLAPSRLLRNAAWLLPYALPPAALAIVLGVQVLHGFESKPARKRERDYWKQNLATWKDAPKPGIALVDLDVSLEPRRHLFHTRGTYTLFNPHPEPMQRLALTLGPRVRRASWTMDGSKHEPENRTNLFVFALPRPLARGDTVRIGFDFEGRVPDGATKNGGGLEEFIEPSGVVLTSLHTTFAPVVGFVEQIGVDPKENKYEPRVYPDDWYRGVVPAGWGLSRPFVTRIRIDAPEEYRLNSIGRLVEESVHDGRRHVLWTSDHPVNFFNIIAGKWAEKRGTDTVVYYHPAHRFNIDEMSRALDGARRYYSEWFYPYPWQDLKLSQFANLATYAEGFATNITFSENIGFLTLSDWRSRAAFTVTAHEAAHQWWGNLLVPGEGPGNDILSEGMSHFSTLLLHEQMNGLQGRMEFAKRIEERYGDQRRVDAERPLVRIDGSKEGDHIVTYDKGGWVFWMLHDLMGREASFAGLRAFLQNHLDNPDHPLLQDFVAEMRPFAPDTTAFDAFTRQWFFEVVVPEYQFEDVRREQSGARWIVTGTLRNAGTGRMPVEIAAVRGDRFVKQTAAEAEAGPAAVSPDYRESRTAVTLAAGESAPFRIECDFEPASLLPDPDARVLQLRRKYAVHRF